MSRRWIVMAAAIAGILALAAGAGARSSGRAWATAAQTTLGSIGEQPTLVFLVKYGQGCSSDGVDCSTRAFERVGTVGPPRNTARQWQSILNQRVNQRYGAASYGRVHWTFRVVANPGSPDGGGRRRTLFPSTPVSTTSGRAASSATQPRHCSTRRSACT